MAGPKLRISRREGFNAAHQLCDPVRSDEEKQAVEAKAAQIAGADKVTSQLEVTPKQ